MGSTVKRGLDRRHCTPFLILVVDCGTKIAVWIFKNDKVVIQRQGDNMI